MQKKKKGNNLIKGSALLRASKLFILPVRERKSGVKFAWSIQQHKKLGWLSKFWCGNSKGLVSVRGLIDHRVVRWAPAPCIGTVWLSLKILQQPLLPLYFVNFLEVHDVIHLHSFFYPCFVEQIPGPLKHPSPNN